MCVKLAECKRSRSSFNPNYYIPQLAGFQWEKGTGETKFLLGLEGDIQPDPGATTDAALKL